MSEASCCPIVELRQYTLLGGRRDTLIALFEREFVETQEAEGMRILGTFRDLDDPDRFVWLRGFADMEARARALGAFYGGPVWKTHRAAANATILDSDNVLLLHPVEAASGIPAVDDARPASPAIVTATIHFLDAGNLAAFTVFFEAQMRPRIVACGGSVVARFVTEGSANTFARLPVRTGEHVFVWFARYADEAAHQAYTRRWSMQSGWRDGTAPALQAALMRKPEVLRLAPTARSALR